MKKARGKEDRTTKRMFELVFVPTDGLPGTLEQVMSRSDVPGPKDGVRGAESV